MYFSIIPNESSSSAAVDALLAEVLLRFFEAFETPAPSSSSKSSFAFLRFLLAETASDVSRAPDLRGLTVEPFDLFFSFSFAQNSLIRSRAPLSERKRGSVLVTICRRV